jgi:hypothetical protein
MESLHDLHPSTAELEAFKARTAPFASGLLRGIPTIGGSDPSVLNRKAPRDAFAPLLDKVGQFLLQEAEILARQPGPIRQFLNGNPLPPSLQGHLPDEYRAFALALNALNQWVSAEQLAIDRYLLGGRARAECRSAKERCIASSVLLNSDDIELHHPVRDGRPPVPLSKKAHARLEGQEQGDRADPVRQTLLKLKRAGNRSWIHLRRGCQDLLDIPVQHTTPKVAASSRTFARQASQKTGMSYQELLSWLN